MPGSLWASLALLGLVPGWIFLIRREKYLRGASRSGLGELLQVSAVGVGLTGAALLLWALFAELLAPFGFVSLDELARLGGAYMASHPRHVISTFALVLGGACGLAWGLTWLAYRSLHDAYKPGSPWEQAFTGVAKDATLWLGIAMKEGPLVEGVLHSFDIGEASEGNRDIVLSRPIYVTEKENRSLTSLDRLVVSSDEIQYLSVVHVAASEATKGTAGKA